mmetsp:Transcript_12013/g.32356  ORF Transcript_12013/g.32356 Transcript_12013/m.32356 type:complete len:217 (-) Transcript_12013:935-1585(-)
MRRLMRTLSRRPPALAMQLPAPKRCLCKRLNTATSRRSALRWTAETARVLLGSSTSRDTQVLCTQCASRPAGVFWRPDRSIAAFGCGLSRNLLTARTCASAMRMPLRWSRSRGARTRRPWYPADMTSRCTSGTSRLSARNPSLRTAPTGLCRRSRFRPVLARRWYTSGQAVVRFSALIDAIARAPRRPNQRRVAVARTVSSQRVCFGRQSKLRLLQ